MLSSIMSLPKHLVNMWSTQKWLLLLGLAAVVWSSNPNQTQVCPSAARRPTSSSEAQDYLLRFGYISVHDLWRGNGKEAISDAIQIFQEMANLNKTGIFDPPTYEMMQKERCGNLDKPEIDFINRPEIHVVANIFQIRRKRFARQETEWHKQHLTYRIMNYTPDLSRDEVDKTIAAAFKVWSDVTPLTFTPSTCDPVDIEIKFASGDHGDGVAFDGQWGTLGHAYFPYDNSPGINGDTHFDEAENWILDDSDDGANLLYTAAHEFGHSLGLLHSTVKDSLMWPWASATRSNVSLSQDDIQGIQSIYGEPEDFDPTEPLPKTNCTLADQPPSDVAPETTSFIPADTLAYITTSHVSSLLTSHTTAAITSTTSAATTPTTSMTTPTTSATTPTTSATTSTTSATTSTTSVTTPTTAKTTSSTTSSTKQTAPMTSPTITTPKWCDGRVDAITEGVDGRIYLFRANSIFRVNRYGIGLDPGFPQPISEVFPHAPSVVDAAVTVSLKGRHGSGRTYLISGTFVWRYRVILSSRTRPLFELDSNFPRSLYSEMKVTSNKIDAAFNAGGRNSDRAYLLEGDSFWEVKFDKKGKTKAKQNPLRKSKILNILPRLDAAFHWNLGVKKYFFHKGEYYRASGSGKKTTLIGPRDTGYWWFECPENEKEFA